MRLLLVFLSVAEVVLRLLPLAAILGACWGVIPRWVAGWWCVGWYLGGLLGSGTGRLAPHLRPVVDELLDKTERARTPIPFRDLLLQIARAASREVTRG